MQVYKVWPGTDSPLSVSGHRAAGHATRGMQSTAQQRRSNMDRKQLTDAFIASEWEREWKEAEQQHGSTVPKDVQQRIADRNRALESVRTWDGGSLAKHLRHLMLPEVLVEEMVAMFGDGESYAVDAAGAPAQQPGKRGAGKADTLRTWCEANRGAPVTVIGLCDAVGVAHNTVRKFMRENPDLFIATDKRGVFTVATAEVQS